MLRNDEDNTEKKEMFENILEKKKIIQSTLVSSPWAVDREQSFF